MRTITTSSGKLFDIEWEPAPVGDMKILLDIQCDMPISEISPCFEGQSILTYTDDERLDITPKLFEGYTDLIGVEWKKNKGIVRLTLEKGAVTNG